VLLGVWACQSEQPEKTAAEDMQEAAPVASEDQAGSEDAAAQAPADEGPGVLTAFADVDEIVGDVPHRVLLDVEVIGGTGEPPFQFRWDFGDATVFSDEKAPEHTYEIPGNFRASVIVRDARGELDQDYVDISVNEILEEGMPSGRELMRRMPLDELAPEIERKLRERGLGAGSGSDPGTAGSQ
ncbi:MAG: PKD domain-containing protein, partial [bacterium]